LPKAIITVPALPAEKQGRHFAKGRNPAETQRMLYGIMIAKAGISTGLCESKLPPKAGQPVETDF